jgi:hypothetical protein
MPTNKEDLRARVFISCGQNKESDERATANAIAETLKALGFEPFIATEQQTLNGIKEHIFETLGNAEYFLFVDFKRERLAGNWWNPWKPPLYRGSLFSHQELALASYLGVDVVAFQESGIKLEGLLAFIGGNATTFKVRARLPIEIENEVRRRLHTGQWNVHWRNKLVLERDPAQSQDVPVEWKIESGGTVRKQKRFFQIVVRNRHRHKAATNCYVYLEKATNLNTSEEQSFQAFELKWEGYRLPYVNIPPEKMRRFDAFSIFHDSPTHLRFSQMFSDWSGVIPSLQAGEGRYELTYLVLSSNFPPARGSFILTLAPMFNLTTLD